MDFYSSYSDFSPDLDFHINSVLLVFIFYFLVTYSCFFSNRLDASYKLETSIKRIGERKLRGCLDSVFENMKNNENRQNTLVPNFFFVLKNKST